MRIGVLSDTHGRQETVRAALQLLDQRGVELVIHCGDIDDAETARLFTGIPTHFVFGNCDWDREGLRQAMGEVGATLHDGFGHLQLAGSKIAWTHGDDARLLRDLERSEAYDYLFHGHTHQATQHQAGPTWVINPGALHRARPKTLLLLDLTTSELESVTVE